LQLGPSTDGFLNYTRPGGLAIQTIWKALEEKGDLHTLANPTLVARSGEKASFLAGGEFPVPVASSGSAGGGTAVTIEWKQFGVKVDFLPTVQDDGSIVLQVMPEVSQLNFAEGIEINGFRIPSLVSRKTGTTVRMDPGQHLVIGGLKQTENTKTVRRIPVLGQIPLLGMFFSHTTTEKVQRELVLVVSPELIGGGQSQLPVLPGEPQK
jgi:pilus assembly protein CpaC